MTTHFAVNKVAYTVESRLTILDFLQSCETKSRMESLDSRLDTQWDTLKSGRGVRTRPT